MTLRQGREFLTIPGPTNIPDEVLNAMHRPAIEIYSGDLLGVTERLLNDLRTVFRTKGRTYIYTANGHGAWEAAISNMLSKGDKVLVLESGRFAVGWGEMAAVQGAQTEVLEATPRRAVDPAAVEARLRADTEHEIKAIMVVQIDTASGIVNDIPAIRKAIDAAGHPALFMVDGMASIGCMPFEMDDWGVDVAMVGSQKGLMSPPGLGLLAAGPKAMEAHKTADLRTHYWDWTAREGEQHYEKYCGTPPEHLLFALCKSMDMLFEEGLEQAWERHRKLAGAVHAAVSVWGKEGAMEMNISDPAERAPSVTPVIFADGVDPAELLKWCNEQCGVVVGSGIGDLSKHAIRIAHMGYVNAPMLLGSLGVLEMGMQALDIPHGKGGAQAAIDFLAGTFKE
ncbi:MAG: aminotransferase class V-fold PLP-dependent enzyme [Alphaproteobacteria bacterium]|nr:aminotransferase class V-fold PLP-dependent enzyme [Alphaproteobacteria bacterium]MBT4545187.1 aminotransferase class V-fold PLP-dependent enzyme [Alphaproteobacteria bacterium]MBT7746556.1 aminotransferase class V-fold PLP-dependent enzyme [Alphaproteobacteria bacterium]